MELKTTFEISEIKKIIHISDLHIKMNSRKDEFIHVFNNFIKKIKTMDLNNTIIVITGDIFDQKCITNTQSAHIFMNFISKCSQLCPIITIPGNHDLDERKLDKNNMIDILTDDFDNVFNLNYTGIYKISDTYFITNSLQDGEFLYHKDLPKEVKKSKHILLYHGAIIGSKTETFTIKEEGIGTRYRNKKDFKDYPIVMLGDIHKQQTIRPGMAYAGSLLQLTSNESIDKHGFLLWDISTCDYEFYEIESNYKIIKLYIDDNKITNPEILKVAENLKIIVYYKNTEYQQVINIINELKNKNYTFSKPICTNEYNNELTNINLTNLDFIKHDSDAFEKIIEKHDMKEELIKYHKELIKDIDIHDVGNSPFHILKLEFRNMYSYGGDKVHTFDFHNGINVISALNASGKTSLFKIIKFALYGHSCIDDVIITHVNNKSDISKSYSEITILKDNKVYIIKRVINKKGDYGKKKAIDQNGNEVPLNLIFTKPTSIKKTTNSNKTEIKKSYITYNSELKNSIIYNKDDYFNNKLKNKTISNLRNNDIIELIGDYDNFNIINTMSNNISNDFINLNDRINFLSKLINIDYFKELKNINAKNKKENNAEIKKYTENKNEEFTSLNQNKFETKEFEQIKTNLSKIKNEIENKKQIISEINSTILIKKDEIIEQQKLIQNINTEFEPDFNINDIKEKLTDIENKLSKYDFDKEFNIELIKHKIEQLNIKDDFDHKKIKKQLSKMKIPTEDYNQLKENIIKLKYETDNINVDPKLLKKYKNQNIEDIDILREKILEGDFVYKPGNYKDKKDLNKILTKINTNNEKLNDIKNEINKIQYELDNINCDYNIKTDEINNIKHIIKTRDELNLGELNIMFNCKITKELEESITNDNIYSFDNADSIIEKIKNNKRIKKDDVIKLIDEFNKLKSNIIEIGEDHKNRAIYNELKNKQKYNELTTKIIAFNKYKLNLDINKLNQEYDNLNNKNDELINLYNYNATKHNNNINAEIKIIENYFMNKQLINNTQMLDEIYDGIKYYELKTQLDKYKEKKILLKQIKYQELINNKNNLIKIINDYNIYNQNNTITEKIKLIKNDINELVEKFEENNKELALCENEFNNLNNKYQEYIIYNDRFTTSENNIKNITKKLTELEFNKKLFNEYDNIIGTSGISTKIIYQKLNILEKNFNDILNKYIGYNIEFHLYTMPDNKNSLVLDIKFIKTNVESYEPVMFNNLSGYEQFICRLAFRIVLNMINTGPHTSCLFIDEAVEVIDTDNFAEKLPEICSLCNSYFDKVYIISQRPIELDTIPITKINIYKDPETQFSSIKII
jgi:hypothetical protein